MVAHLQSVHRNNKPARRVACARFKFQFLHKLLLLNILPLITLLNLTLTPTSIFTLANGANLQQHQGDHSVIKVTRFQVPAQARAGELRRLTCLYELRGATLHAMKLFKDDKEFYRYTPSDHKMTFPVAGVHVELNRSNEREVWLRINKRSMGQYKCQVSIEGTFNSVSAEKRMDVVGADSMSHVGIVSTGGQTTSTGGAAHTQQVVSSSSSSWQSAAMPHRDQQHLNNQQSSSASSSSSSQYYPPGHRASSEHFAVQKGAASQSLFGFGSSSSSSSSSSSGSGACSTTLTIALIATLISLCSLCSQCHMTTQLKLTPQAH